MPQLPDLAGALFHTLTTSEPAAGYAVAYSGGRDSHVLLHLVAQISAELAVPIRALHINHQLHPDAAQWATHCADVCNRLGIPLVTVTVDAAPHPGESPEAAARRVRYGAFEQVLQEQEVLLQAHHQDDQAETVLLRLLRGAGTRGLMGMPQRRPLGRGSLNRPLLGVNRATIDQYAASHGLHFVEDPSNREVAFDRNYLRGEVLPAIAQRWPGYAGSFLRSAQRCQDAEQVLQTVWSANRPNLIGRDGSLDLAVLGSLPSGMQRWGLAQWLVEIGAPMDGLPASDRLAEALRQFREASPDRGPELGVGSGRIRRFQDRLYWVNDPPSGLAEPVPWTLGEALEIPELGGRLAVTEACSPGIDRRWRGQQFRVTTRRGGERCRPVGRGGRHTLKNLFHEAAIAPWLRSAWPLIYRDDTLAVIPGLCVCEGFEAPQGVPALQVHWERH